MSAFICRAFMRGKTSRILLLPGSLMRNWKCEQQHARNLASPVAFLPAKNLLRQPWLRFFLAFKFKTEKNYDTFKNIDKFANKTKMETFVETLAYLLMDRFWRNLKITSESVYSKIVSSNTSHLEAHVGFFRLLKMGIFGPYVLWPFDKKLIF